MTKHRSPSELNTRTIRIGIGDYALLTEISRRVGVTMAEALRLVITEQAKREAIVVPRSQISMPTFRVKSPVALRVTPQPILATNGHKAGILVIKPKGGVISD